MGNSKLIFVHIKNIEFEFLFIGAVWIWSVFHIPIYFESNGNVPCKLKYNSRVKKMQITLTIDASYIALQIFYNTPVVYRIDYKTNW